MRPARLHVVSDDAVVADPRFETTAKSLIRAHGSELALHLRAKRLTAARLHELAAALSPEARAAGGALLVNDRADVALATDAGVQLGSESLPVSAIRELVGPDRQIGYSAHAAGEAATAAGQGADFVLLGTIWASPSHPETAGAGPGLVRETAAATRTPVIAIGGVSPERAIEAVGAGAYGVAVLSGVWGSSDPVAAAGRYLEALRTEMR